MKLHHFNLIGVLLLAGLCVGQWVKDRELNLEINRLQQATQQRDSRLADQEKILRGLNADLSEFKGRATGSGEELKETRLRLAKAERELRQVGIERDQLKTSVTNWAAAVTIRDERLKEATTENQRLTEELRGSITKFNSLATNYNTAVKDLNELRARFTQPRP